MNRTTNDDRCICTRLFLSNIDKSHLEKSEGGTSIVLYIVPRPNQPYDASHAVYQGIPGAKGEEHPIVGHARFYRSDKVPAELQTPDLFQ